MEIVKNFIDENTFFSFFLSYGINSLIICLIENINYLRNATLFIIVSMVPYYKQNKNVPSNAVVVGNMLLIIKSVIIDIKMNNFKCHLLENQISNRLKT